MPKYVAYITINADFLSEIEASSDEEAKKLFREVLYNESYLKGNNWDLNHLEVEECHLVSVEHAYKEVFSHEDLLKDFSSEGNPKED